MGRHDIQADLPPSEFRAFTKALLTDLRALDHMLEHGMIESGVRRLGAEQELFLVDRGMRPAPVGPEVLAMLPQPPFTTEIARFNLEINLDPMHLRDRCFRDLEDQLNTYIEEVRDAADAFDAEVALMGILPTVGKSDLGRELMTAEDRYVALNEALSRMCGAVYRLHIQGADELHVEHDSVMLEGATNGTHVHLQVSHEEFPRFYNAAQAIAAPVLAVATNSPILFGRRLWSETRIPLFQQAIDTRGASSHIRVLTPRARFGDRWVEKSILEMFMEDVSRIPALLGRNVREQPFDILGGGGIPQLEALQIYNSTVYRWNRPCYGVTDGAPHIRIENRYLPSGPTVVDEVANMAFWAGAVLGGAEHFGDVDQRLDYGDARDNFVAAARRGLNAGFSWLEGTEFSASDLMLKILLPMANEGLLGAGVAEQDVSRYLGIIEDRVTCKCTGSLWQVASLRNMGTGGTAAERLAALVGASVRLQRTGQPGHSWPRTGLGEAGGWRHNYLKVEQYMTTDLYTVREDELVDLTAFLMDWKHIRQIPVEDEHHHLVGMVNYGTVLRHLAAEQGANGEKSLAVRDIMDPCPPTITPETSTLDAIRFMRERKLTCLPVTKSGALVGIVSVDDFAPIAERLLEERIEDA